MNFYNLLWFLLNDLFIHPRISVSTISQRKKKFAFTEIQANGWKKKPTEKKTFSFQLIVFMSNN